MEQDWYEAVVIANSILGDAFPVGETCVYRRVGKSKSARRFEIFNLKDVVKPLTGAEAKRQLRAARDSHNNVVRARDQGYINWKYASVD